MLKKIPREECLERYPVFPLRNFDEVEDEEDFFYPKVIAGQWMNLDLEKGEEFAENLSKELTKLLRTLGIEQLVFLGDTDQNWISQLALERNDYQPLTEAVNYFIQHQINTAFNGGVMVGINDLQLFLKHFYTLTRCDGSLPYFHFIDNHQQFLGAIHYTGQVRIDRFSREADLLFQQLFNRKRNRN